MAFAKFKVKKGLTISDSFIPSGYDEVPVGLILPYSKQTPPSGWLMCDGTSTSGYSELAAIVGATTPNLNGSVIVGRGTGLGADASGSGQITGTALPSVAINSSPSSASTNPMVDFSHSHPLASHTHDIAHTHNYPHTHSFLHYHTHPHSHTTSASSGLSDHQHSSWFTNSIGTGSGGRAANSISGSANFPTTSSGEHTHPGVGSATASIGSSGNSYGGSAAVNSFDATGTTTTGTNNNATGSFGSASSPSGAFSIVQPIIGVYFIIKY